MVYKCNTGIRFSASCKIVCNTGNQGYNTGIEFRGNMPNPNPVQSDLFKAKRHPAKYPDDPLSDKAIAIRFRTSVDKKLRAIPEYSGLVRDCVDKYFDDLANPQPVAPARVSTDDESELTDEQEQLVELLLSEKCTGDGSHQYGVRVSPRMRKVIDEACLHWEYPSATKFITECVIRYLLAEGVDILADKRTW
jgi:hypothetical protein